MNGLCSDGVCSGEEERLASGGIHKSSKSQRHARTLVGSRSQTFDGLSLDKRAIDSDSDLQSVKFTSKNFELVAFWGIRRHTKFGQVMTDFLVDYYSQKFDDNNNRTSKIKQKETKKVVPTATDAT